MKLSKKVINASSFFTIQSCFAVLLFYFPSLPIRLRSALTMKSWTLHRSEVMASILSVSINFLPLSLLITQTAFNTSISSILSSRFKKFFNLLRYYGDIERKHFYANYFFTSSKTPRILHRYCETRAAILYKTKSYLPTFSCIVRMLNPITR